MSETIRTISRDELQAKLNVGDDVKLVKTLHEWAYRAAHIWLCGCQLRRWREMTWPVRRGGLADVVAVALARETGD